MSYELHLAPAEDERDCVVLRRAGVVNYVVDLARAVLSAVSAIRSQMRSNGL